MGFWSGPRGPLLHLTCILSFIAWLSLQSAAHADSTVDDETGLMTPDAIAQIDARNTVLQNATGTIVVVVVQHGRAGQSSADASAVADKFTPQKYGAVLWVATDMQKTDIIFVGPALKWVPADQQDALRQELLGKMAFCCPSDTVPTIVDKLATAMENGARVPSDPRNYVHDELGLLSDAQISTIAAREQQLESATGKGVGVVLTTQQPGKQSSMLALVIAETLNVKGNIAAVVWAARNGGTINFSMMRVPGHLDAIPDSTTDNINSNFQADMQSGQLGDAIIAAVDRTAAALQATSTPMPATAPAIVAIVQSPGPGGSAAQNAANPSAAGYEAASPQPKGGESGSTTGLLVLIGFAVVIVIVTMALRRRNQFR